MNAGEPYSFHVAASSSVPRPMSANMAIVNAGSSFLFFLVIVFVLAFVFVFARRDPDAGNARAEPALARRRVLSAEGIDEIVPDEPNGRPIDSRQRRAVNPARVPVPRRRRGRAAEVLPAVAVSRRVDDVNAGGSNPGRVLLPPSQRRHRLRAPRAAPRHRELEIVTDFCVRPDGRDEGHAGLAGTRVGFGSHRRHRASRHGDRLVDGIGPRVRAFVVLPPFPVVGEDDKVVIVPVARQPELAVASPVFKYDASTSWMMAYLTGAVALTAARGGEYAPTQCFVPGAAAVTVTRTTSSHSSPSSSSSFEARGVSRRQETENPAALRASRRDVGSGNRIRAGSIAERGWCSSLNPPPDGDGVAGGRLRGRRGRRESRQKRDLATLEKARGDARGSEARSGVSKLTIRDSGPRRRIRAGARGRAASSRRERPSSPRLAVAAAPVVVVLLFYPRVREDGGSLVAEKTRADSKQAPPRRRSQSERAR